MKKIAYGTLAAILFFVTSASLGAVKLQTKGQAWLNAHADPATIRIDGHWYDRDWGTIALQQEAGGRELTGAGDGWDVHGVVSGNKVYLLFTWKGDVAYSAILTAISHSEMKGSYVRGLMKEEGSGKPMDMTR